MRKLPSDTFWLAPLGGAFALLLTAASLSAQDPDSTRAIPDSIILGQEVRVSVTRPRLAQTGGSSRIELQLDSMSVIPAPRLEDVLRRIPLMQVRFNSRGEAQPALRGAEDRQIAVLVDGVPVTLGWDHRTDLSIVPLTAARSVNLMRGASSVLFGPNVLGGVVEIDVVRGARPTLRATPASLSLGVDATGATAVAGTVGSLTDFDSGQWLVDAGFGFRDRSGAALPDLDTTDPIQLDRLVSGDDANLRLNSDYTQFDAFVASRFRAENGSWASATVSAITAERGVPPEAHEEEPRLWRYPNQQRLIAAVSAGTGQRDTGAGTGDIEASLGVDVGEFQIDAFETLAYERVSEVELGDDRTITARLLADHTLGSAGDFRSAFTYGDVYHKETLLPGGLSEYRQRLWSLAGETDWRLGELFGARGLRGTNLSVGFALDGADTPRSGDKPPLERLWDWGAHLGLSSILSGSDVVMHAGLSRRARFPSLRELYSGALGRFLPNPELRPEVQWSGEIGITWSTDPIDLQLVGFRQELQDGIVRARVEDAEGTKFQRINSDRVESTGVELVGSGDAGPVRWAADLTYQRTWLIDENGVKTRPEYEPRWVSSVDVSFPVLADIQFAAGFDYQAEQFCVSGSEAGLDRLEANESFGLELRRTFRRPGGGRLRNMDLILGMENVTDAPIYDQCGLPQPGRTLTAQIRLF